MSMMLQLCSMRRAAVTPLVLIGVLIAAARAAHAQLPSPRLTSLSRPGTRAGEAVEVSLRGTDLDGVTQLWFDHPGIQSTHLKDLTFRVVSLPDVPLGHHDVRAFGTFGVSNPRAFVVGDRPESIETEPNNVPEKANPIVTNTVINGELNGGTDVDCFAFAGKKGQRLFLDLEAERIDSRLDATIRVISPDGTELAESRDVFGADPFLDVTLPADGRYSIKLHDATYAGSPDHFYRLTVHEGPHLDAILPMAALPGTPVPFTLIGRGLGGLAITDGRDKADGRALERVVTTISLPEIARREPGPWSGARMFVPSAAAVTRHGFEYAHVRVNPTGAAPAVSNPLYIAHPAGPVALEREPNDDQAHAQKVEPPCDISGTFAAVGDLDVYQFRGRKGQVWWIEAFAERMGSMADPTFVVQKIDARGQAQDIASADDLPDGGTGPRFNTQTVDAALRWQVPEDGLYQVLISDLHASQRGQPRLTYRLVIRPEQPDFALVLVPDNAAAVDAVTIRAGGRAAASVLAIRRDGFAGPIRVEGRDLPAGVSAAPVTVGPGQVTAPIVFVAVEKAGNAVGTVTLVGHGRFGDRKETLEYVAGALSLGPDLTHVALAGAMTWPPNATVPAVAPARAVNGFVVAVRGEPAPLTVTARPEKLVAAQGRHVNMDIEVARREGFVEAVALTTTDLPPNMPAATVTIPKEAKAGVLSLFVPKNVPPGVFSFLIRGTGAFPFSKDPKAKQKPNINLTEPSNPIAIIVRPAPVSLAVNNKGGALKQGAALEVDVTIARQNGFAGPVTLVLSATANLKLTAKTVEAAANQGQAKLVVQAAKDSPAGTAPQVFVRAVAIVRGEAVEVDEPIGLTIIK
jgi:hypothetical protein